jgi:putative selenate reductase molybdopterin-binding subunit
MKVELRVNSQDVICEVEPQTSLLRALRQVGFFSVKYGCDTGHCGACAVLLDGKLVNSCQVLAVQAAGCCIQTAEGLGSPPDLGWKETPGLHPLQQAFIEVGAIQCGYCTPAMLLAGKELLDRKGYGSAAQPVAITEDEAREALSGVLCRCTGYVKPVEAILRTAASLRGEAAPPITDSRVPSADHDSSAEPRRMATQTVGQPKVKVDGSKLAQGKPAFTDDFEVRGMLFAKVLRSSVAHARIQYIDASRARALPGVAAVLTYQDIPRVPYSTAGQSDPLPSSLDTFSLDAKVRFVGDRVAFVAAETEAIAEAALGLIDVVYEELPCIVDPRDAQKPGAPIIHDEPEFVPFGESDPQRNLAAHIFVDIGNVDQGFAEADYILENEFLTPKVQQVSLEPHVVICYWDEDDRLVIRSSTQVPFHARRILAPVLGLPVKRIRVIKPRIGGGFGGKQEVLIEDVAAHLTIATGRPVRFEYTRTEEFVASSSRHPMRVRVRTGVKADGTLTANEMHVLSDTGAYGSHAMTVAGNTGHKSMALYVGDGLYRQTPNIRFTAEVVYTNTAPSGAFRGYGVPQGFFPVERQMEQIAAHLGIDPLVFRLKNALRQGELHPFSTAWSEGRAPQPEYIRTCGLAECARVGAESIGWEARSQGSGVKAQERRVSGSHASSPLRRGIGVALMMQGSAIPFLDMGGASIKINDDGSFNLLIGATDIGTGSDTVLAQMAAEVLGCPVEDMIVYSSDTDFTPFDVGAYASSTTYISGGAVTKAAQIVAAQIREVAAAMLSQDGTLAPESIRLAEGKAWAPDGRAVTLGEVGLNSLHHTNQRQIMGAASHFSPVAPPPFAAQFAEVTVDTETGEVRVTKLVTAMDSGVIINPTLASGQVEGAMAQALGYAVCEEMPYRADGQPLARDLSDYHIFSAAEMPELVMRFVETVEPSHPFGVKAVGEIGIVGIAPAVVNAIHDATGVWLNEIPATPERVWRALQTQSQHTGA